MKKIITLTMLLLMAGTAHAASQQKPKGHNCTFDQGNRYTVIQYKDGKRLDKPVASIKRHGVSVPTNQHHLFTYGALKAVHEGTVGKRFNRDVFGSIGATYEVCDI